MPRKCQNYFICLGRETCLSAHDAFLFIKSVCQKKNKERHPNRVYAKALQETARSASMHCTVPDVNCHKIWRKKKIIVILMRIIYQVFCCWCPYWYHWHNTFFVLRMLLVILTYSDTIKILATLQTHSCCWQCSADVPYFGSCGNYLACSLGMEERYSSRAHVLWPSHRLMV